MANQNKNTVPPSREVRLEDGITLGVYEHLLFAAHTGDTGALLHAMDAAELINELERSKAVEDYRLRLLTRMAIRGGVLGQEDLNIVVEEWHRDEVLV